MLKKIQLRIPVQWLVPLLVFLATAALAAGLRELGRSRSDSPLLTLFIIALPVLAAAAAVYLVRIREERIHLDRRRDWLEKQLRGTMQLNHLLVNARHENELIEHFSNRTSPTPEACFEMAKKLGVPTWAKRVRM